MPPNARLSNQSMLVPPQNHSVRLVWCHGEIPDIVDVSGPNLFKTLKSRILLADFKMAFITYSFSEQIGKPNRPQCKRGCNHGTDVVYVENIR